MAEPEIDDERIAAVCRVLLDHRVDFVVIGGVAARLHDTVHGSVDLCFAPAGFADGYKALRPGEVIVVALPSLEAHLRNSAD